MDKVLISGVFRVRRVGLRAVDQEHHEKSRCQIDKFITSVDCYAVYLRSIKFYADRPYLLYYRLHLYSPLVPLSPLLIYIFSLNRL